MQELRQAQFRPQTLNVNNNAVSGNNAGTVDENGFSYRDLLQQFQDQSQNSAKKREQNTSSPSKQPTPINETSAKAMLNNLSFISGSYNAASRFALGSSAGKNIESQKVLMGDFNDDGILDTDDVMAMQDHITEKKKITDPNMLKRMDLNSDGEIDVFDLTKLTNTIIGREGKKYIEIETQKKELIKGDLNDDGVIDDVDSELMKKTVLKQNPYTKAADFDDDGTVTATDLSAFNQARRELKEANSSGIRGDINNDGKLTISDVNLLNNFFNGKISSAHLYNEDVNGDGELSKDDLEAVQNLVKYGKTQKPTGIRGDINNDGEVSFVEDGITLLNRLNGMDTETEIYNEDIDGNGVVDMNDFEAFKNLYNYGKMQEPSGIKGDIDNDGEVDILDITKLNKYLQGKENIENIYNEDVNDDGVVDENDAKSIENLILYGSINAPEPVAPVQPAPDPGYQPWTAVVSNKMPAYHDAELTDRRNNEEVWVGDEVTILDETDNAYKMQYWSNALGDYKIRWVSKSALAESNDSGYQPWTATIQRKTPAYWDENLTDRRNGEEVWVGDNVTILDETDRAYKMQYYSNAIGDYKIRWVSKSALAESNDSGYQPWTATIQRNTPAYWDENLTDRRNGEEVWVGDNVTILDETDRAYKMQYYSNAIGDYKIRWVSKSALSATTNYESNDIYQKLEQLRGNHVGFRDNDVYDGDGQCRGFANRVYFELFGLSGISGYSDYNYAASSHPGSYVAGQLYNFNSSDTGAVQQLFSDIKPGAMVQMGRRGRLNSTGTAARPHTAIVNSVNADGVEFYEANVAGANVIKTKFYSWADLARANQGFTVYMPENYPTAENKPSPPVLPGFVQPAPVAPPITPPVTPTPTPNWPPNNPIIKPVTPHTGTTTTEPLPERRTGSGRVFDLTHGYRNISYIANGGGLFIYNMNVNENDDSETPISFDLYNTQNAAGYIEYYDENGKLIGADRVEPHSHVITDVEKWFSEAGKLFNSTLLHGLESPVTDEYNSTRTKINAPKGTRSIVVTNNSTESMYAQVSNMVDKWFESLDMLSKIKDVVSSYKDLKNDTINQILVVPVKEKISEHIINNLIESGVKSSLSGIKSGSQSTLDTLAQEGIQNRLKHIVQGVDVGKTIADTIAENGLKIGIDMAKSVAYDMAKAAIGANPAIVGYEAMTLIGKGLDSLDKTLTEEKLKKVKPMIFQL